MEFCRPIKKKPKKHLLVISQYFYPEQFRINDICSEWIKRGYKVTVITGIPNYPQGEFYNNYNLFENREEIWRGIDIIRIPIIPRGKSVMGLCLNYLSFVISGFFWKIFTKIEADLVFIYETSPMTQALVGVWYANRMNIPCYLYVTDLWPENVEAVTGIHNRFIIGGLQKLVDYIYKESTKILTSSYSFITSIKARGISERKMFFWPHYAEDFYKPRPDACQKKELKEDVLKFVFAGNIGYAQGLKILVDSAKILKEKNIRIQFVLIGDGRYKKELIEKIKKQKLNDYFNIIGRKPAEEIPLYLANADVLLITLAKSKVYSKTIPSKTQSCLACGKPILVSADGEVQQIILEAKAGLVGDAEDCNKFVENIMSFKLMKHDELDRLGKSALEYYKCNFEKEKLLDQIDKIFMENK